MPLRRQLEFAFRSTAVARIGDPGRLSPSQDAGVADPGYNNVNRQLNLEETARALLRANGAARIAHELRVEWNSRLKTAAGRADFRQKLISLNPRLCDYGEAEIERTLRHELAHLLAQFRAGRRRILPHALEWRDACCDLGIGDEVRCHNLPFPVSERAPRFFYKCPNCAREFPRVRRIKRAVACLACCRAHNGGEFDARFRLQRVTAAL